MTKTIFPANDETPPIREVEDMSAAEHKADIERALPILAAKINAFSGAVVGMTKALKAEPNDPAALREASDAIYDARNAVGDNDVADVAASAGWLADALEREAK